MNNPEQYENLIALLKEALKFYADEKNYRKFMDNELFPPIEIDNGHQARFALKQINELNEINKEIESDYNKIINNVRKEDSTENVIKIIDKLKNIGNEEIH